MNIVTYNTPDGSHLLFPTLSWNVWIVEYADAYRRNSSYLQLMSLIGYNPLTAIQIALQNKAANSLTNIEQNAPTNGSDRLLKPNE